MQRSTLAKLGWIFLFIAIAAFYLWGLGSWPLVGPDEPRYAQVAREMLERGDLITPTLGGRPWFEKPPLLYWMMIAAYRVLGVNEYAARLGPALCGLLTAVFVYWIAKIVPTSSQGDSAEDAPRSEIGRWSALAWLSTLGAIAFSRGASFDIVLTMTVTGALACFFAGHLRAARGSVRLSAGGSPPSVAALWLLMGFYCFTGLSILAKGLIGPFIIFAVIGLYYLVRREWPARKVAISLLWGIPLALGFAALWFGPILWRHGWTFIDQFIIQHHFARFTSNKYHHPGPIYFYLPVLIGLALPWTIFLISSLVSSRRWVWRGISALDRLRVFALIWLVVPVVFFSFSGSKLVAYILPVLPAVALLVGERVVCFVRVHRGQRVLRITGALLLFCGIAGTAYAVRWLNLAMLPLVMAALPLFAVGLAAVIRPRFSRGLCVAIAAAVFVTAIGAHYVAAPIGRRESVRDLLAAATERGYVNTRVVQLHNIERTAEFYAARRVEYGADGEPVKFEGAMQVLDAASRNGGSVLCFVPLEFKSQLTSYPAVQTEVIGDNGRVALLAVRAR